MKRTLIASFFAASVAVMATPAVTFAAVEDVTTACLSAECSTPATQFLAALPAAQQNSQVIDLVLGLVAVAQQDPACNDVDRRAANAVEAAAGFAVDAAQRQRILDIAASLRDCRDVTTAAIRPPAPPTNPSGPPSNTGSATPGVPGTNPPS